MGVAEAETLRRVNARLTGFDNAFDKGVYLRTFLADERLVPRDGERFLPEPDQIEDCRRRGEQAVDYLRGTPVDVVATSSTCASPGWSSRGAAPDRSAMQRWRLWLSTWSRRMLGDVRRLRQGETRSSEVDTGWWARLRRQVRRTSRLRRS